MTTQDDTAGTAINPYDLDAFTCAYVECALWSSTDDDGEPLDDGRDASDIAPEALASMVEDCKDFRDANADDLARAYETEGYDESRAGHDFWLTRNGHGAGFWDRGLGGVGDKLSRASKVYGGVDLYVGDDGQVYSS